MCARALDPAVPPPPPRRASEERPRPPRSASRRRRRRLPPPLAECDEAAADNRGRCNPRNFTRASCPVGERRAAADARAGVGERVSGGSTRRRSTGESPKRGARSGARAAQNPKGLPGPGFGRILTLCRRCPGSVRFLHWRCRLLCYRYHTSTALDWYCTDSAMLRRWYSVDFIRVLHWYWTCTGLVLHWGKSTSATATEYQHDAKTMPSSPNSEFRAHISERRCQCLAAPRRPPIDLQSNAGRQTMEGARASVLHDTCWACWARGARWACGGGRAPGQRGCQRINRLQKLGAITKPTESTKLLRRQAGAIVVTTMTNVNVKGPAVCRPDTTATTPTPTSKDDGRAEGSHATGMTSWPW